MIFTFLSRFWYPPTTRKSLFWISQRPYFLCIDADSVLQRDSLERIVQPVMEYDRSFLVLQILLDGFNGNLIISGAFGLFKKSVAIAAGGYAKDVLRKVYLKRKIIREAQ